jgi:hypothetical protein
MKKKEWTWMGWAQIFGSEKRFKFRYYIMLSRVSQQHRHHFLITNSMIVLRMVVNSKEHFRRCHKLCSLEYL